MAHYLVYWKPATVVDSTHPTVFYSASNQYGRVRSGDYLWIVTSEGEGDLVLVGRQRVDRVLGREEARQVLPDANLWDAAYYATTEQPEEKLNRVISRYAAELRFQGEVDRLPQDFTGKNLQAMRKLEAASHVLLEGIWADRDDLVDVA